MTEERTGEMTMDGCCWLCGKNGRGDPLDTHHIFGGAYRNKSEKYGLTVQLCHENCHIFGKYAAHANAETMRRLREYGQREAMRRFGWTVEQFRREFGKNYLDECGVWSVECGVEVSASRQTENTSPARGLATSPQGEDRARRRIEKQRRNTRVHIAVVQQKTESRQAATCQLS